MTARRILTGNNVMTDGLITSKFDRALTRSPLPRAQSPGERLCANFGIVSFLSLATALGIAETEFVPERDKFAWRGWGAPIGMVQYWRVFAPDLRDKNWHSTALIEFADGTLKYYEFPRPQFMSMTEAFVKAKERTFFYELLANKNYAKMLPDIARYLARANFDQANQPRTVTLIFNYALMPAPDPNKWTYISQLAAHTKSGVFFVYRVQAQDLEDLSQAQAKH